MNLLSCTKRHSKKKKCYKLLNRKRKLKCDDLSQAIDVHVHSLKKLYYEEKTSTIAEPTITTTAQINTFTKKNNNLGKRKINICK